MGPSPNKKKDQALTQQELDQLLAFLNSDPEKAANEYLRIRKKIIFFLQSRGCRAPEDYADVTEKRVARKLSEGEDIQTSDPARYFYAVASKVLQESWADLSQKSISLDDPSIFVQLSQDPFEEAVREAERLQLEREMKCLEKCLGKLPSKNRYLILQYYQGETSIKISNRKKIAEQLGIPINALRIRALRIREKLQDCVSECVRRLTDA